MTDLKLAAIAVFLFLFLFLFCSLATSLLCRWHDRSSSASRTIIGCSPGTDRGHRPSLRPGEVTGTPSGLDQCRSQTGSCLGEGPPWPSPPLSHARSPIGHSLGADGGRRPPPELSEMTGMLLGLHQCGSRIGSYLGEGPSALILSSSLPCPVPHRTLAQCRWGLAAAS